MNLDKKVNDTGSLKFTLDVWAVYLWCPTSIYLHFRFSFNKKINSKTVLLFISPRVRAITIKPNKMPSKVSVRNTKFSCIDSKTIRWSKYSFYLETAWGIELISIHRETISKSLRSVFRIRIQSDRYSLIRHRGKSLTPGNLFQDPKNFFLGLDGLLMYSFD